MLRHRFHSSSKVEGFRDCPFCGAKKKYIDIHFESGSVEPTDDETITGATSSNTGKILENSLVLLSGTWLGEDAEGWVTLYDSTGSVLETGQWGSEDEELNGSTGGDNMFQIKGYGIVKNHGILIPISQMVERDGVWYCREHYEWRFGGEDRDYQNSLQVIDESDRGEEW